MIAQGKAPSLALQSVLPRVLLPIAPGYTSFALIEGIKKAPTEKKPPATAAPQRVPTRRRPQGAGGTVVAPTALARGSRSVFSL